MFTAVAVNWDHSEEYAKAVYDTLNQYSTRGRDGVIEALTAIGDVLKQGKKFRGL
jgi:hypothetical protein